MNDSPHLKLLRKSLAQCEDGIGCVSSDHDRKVLEQDADELRKDIKRLEKWETKQKAISEIPDFVQVVYPEAKGIKT